MKINLSKHDSVFFQGTQRKSGLHTTEFLVLFLIVSLTWFIGVLYYSSDLKFKFYVDTDDQFMERLDGYFNSSIKAREDMTDWLTVNYKQAHLNSPNETLFYQKSDNPKLCVAVATTKRNAGFNRNYVSQTIIALLTRVSLSEQDNIRIILFNANSQRNSVNSELYKLNYLVHTEEIRKSRFNFDNYSHEPKIKEASDYANILKSLYNHKDCQYGLLIEDDSIAAPDWYPKVKDAINQIEYNGRNNWLCLKLFISYRFTDWLVYIPTVFSSILFLIWLLFIECLIFQIVRVQLLGTIKRERLLSLKKLNKQAIIIITVNLIIFISFINSSSIKPFGYGLKQYSQGFNTVALIFPRQQFTPFANYLEKSIQNYISEDSIVNKFVPKDLSMNIYRNKMNLKEYIIEPAIFQHVGVHSSLRNLRYEPTNIKNNQYRPFQSYSFMKHYNFLIKFDPNFWLKNKYF